MALSSFLFNIANNIFRNGSVLVRDAAASGAPPAKQYHNLGQIQDTKVSYEPVSVDPDSAKRSKQIGTDIAVSFAMLQTADSVLAHIDDLTDILLDVLVTKTAQSGTVLDADAAAAAVDGFILLDVLVNVAVELDLGGGPSKMTLTVPLRVPTSDLAAL